MPVTLSAWSFCIQTSTTRVELELDPAERIFYRFHILILLQLKLGIDDITTITKKQK